MSQAFLILGASRGIGFNVAQRLVADGHRVMMCGRDEVTLQRAAESLQQPSQVCDARDWEQTKETVVSTSQLFEGLDGAVNCAGPVSTTPTRR
ncbi:MAG: SDR family NAD(P)-dependent oxidoreductase, partial [Planctomycetota bacterium]